MFIKVSVQSVFSASISFEIDSFMFSMFFFACMSLNFRSIEKETVSLLYSLSTGIPFEIRLYMYLFTISSVNPSFFAISLSIIFSSEYSTMKTSCSLFVRLMLFLSSISGLIVMCISSILSFIFSILASSSLR